MRPGGLSSAFGGNLAMMDVYAAQMVFGRGRTFDRIDLALTEGVTVDQVPAACREPLGPGFEVEPPARAAAQFESVARVYAISMSLTSAVRAVHRDVHHLQLVLDRGDPAAGRDRHPARAGRDARQMRRCSWARARWRACSDRWPASALGSLLARAMTGYISTLCEGVYGMAERADEVTRIRA